MSGKYGFGSTIDKFRKERGLTKASLARKANVHRSMITRIINEERGISKELLNQLCIILKIQIVKRTHTKK